MNSMGLADQAKLFAVGELGPGEARLVKIDGPTEVNRVRKASVAEGWKSWPCCPMNSVSS